MRPPPAGSCHTSRGGSAAPSILLLVAVAHLLSPDGAAGQWLSPPGAGWIEATLYYHDTHQEFDQDGARRDIFADGRATTLSLFLTGTVGIRQGLDAWVQVPVHGLRYEDAAGVRRSRGVGDPRGFLRAGPALVGLPAWPVALRGGVKLAGGDFDVDAEIIPLGEGQRDWELLLEIGRSFHPRRAWTMGWVGYRWRSTNREAARTPGNERFWFWSAGGDAGPMGWKVSAEGIHGDAWVIEGLRIESARRSLVQLFLGVDRDLGPGRLGVGARFPVRGRNLPSGAALVTSYFLRWGGS